MRMGGWIGGLVGGLGPAESAGGGVGAGGGEFWLVRARWYLAAPRAGATLRLIYPPPLRRCRSAAPREPMDRALLVSEPATPPSDRDDSGTCGQMEVRDAAKHRHGAWLYPESQQRPESEDGHRFDDTDGRRQQAD